MLLRASRRRLPRNVAFQTLPDAEQLQLPFLCPALYRSISSQRRTSSHSRPPLDANGNVPRPTFRHREDAGQAPSRGLASAAGQATFQEHYIPWDTPSHGPYRKVTSSESRKPSPPGAFDLASSPLVLDHTPVTVLPAFRATGSISGDVNEIHQTLHACLQVGRFDRAAALVRRLGQLYKRDAPGLLAAHKDYVREVTLRITRTRDMRLLQDLLSWFELEMRRQGILQDASTFALIIQASLQDPNPKRRARMIKRYYSLAREAGVEDETRDLVPELESVLEGMSWYLEHGSPPGSTDTSHQAAASPMHAVPDIRSVDMKGYGLSTLKKSLSLLGEDKPSAAAQETNGSLQALSDVDRQRILEQETVTIALERWRTEDAHLKSLGINSSLDRYSLGSAMWRWHEKLVPAIEAELRKADEAERKETRSQDDDERLQWSPYLQSLSVEKLSGLTIIACMNMVSVERAETRGARLVTVLDGLGRWIQEENYKDRSRKEGGLGTWRRLSRFQGSTRSGGFAAPSPSAPSSTAAPEAREDPLYEMTVWPAAIKMKIGAVLLSLLMDIAKIEVSRHDPKTGLDLREDQPVFFHTYEYQAGKRVGTVRLNSAMLEKLSQAPVGCAIAKHLPMVSEPKPWTGYREGGFLEHTLPVVRSKSSDVQTKRYAMAAAGNGDMAEIFAGLDVLGRTPWKINRGIFEIMAVAWNTGEAIANFPPENAVSDPPPEPPRSEDPRDRRKWLKKVQESENVAAGLRSQRCFMNFQMEVARAYIGETFYFPHNVDFRGRAYPMAPFLNHMGADNARGLLVFAKGKELGMTGLWWLKVHLANVYGYDKASFEERQKFTEDHFDDVCDSAAKPLDGRRWWLAAEDPWQCLAACLELRAALDLPDPTRYVSHLAVHQDGTCNGLQHYAALGGDIVGAKQVNLEPGNRPSDIYTGVAEIIKAEVKEEAAKGDAMAKHLEGRLTRKVVKQTVMTNVYGVTFVGAKRQVQRQLEALLPGFPDTKELNIALASEYIARKIFGTLATMFNGAHNIQYWLGECAGRICQSVSASQAAALERESKGEAGPSAFLLRRKGKKIDQTAALTSFISPVIWTTPLKMPVVQPYRKDSYQRVDTRLQNLSLRRESSSLAVDKARQLQAFPPNFIHSLDGTHMFLTALRCAELGLAFASVHDSFWTHAADVDTMNKITRDAFIRMHSENIPARLAAEFKARYKDHLYKGFIKFHSPIGRKIRQWRHEHMPGLHHGKLAPRGQAQELLLEWRRLRLLASDDPAEQEEGRNMVTPGSLYAEVANDEDLAVPSDELPTTLGETSTKRVNPQAVEAIDVEELDTAGESDPHVDQGAVTVASGAADDDATTATDMSGGGEERLEASTHLDNQKEPAGVRNPGRRKQATNVKLWLWLPLTFPPVPEKGTFDVTRLKDSPYFFS